VIPKILAMVLAGGEGERLYPLSAHRSKPAVHFGGIYRLIDFILTNLVNSGIYSIYVLTQYKAQSLLGHLQHGWVSVYPMNSFFIIPVPAQMRVRKEWYLGTADAIYQNVYLIKRFRPDLVAIFGSDHVYFMDIRQMIDFHLKNNADVTVATIPYPISECQRFGVLVTDENWQIKAFQEKVPDPTPMPNDPSKGLVSMGNYIFNTDVILEELEVDANDKESHHDFGKDILPGICPTRRVFAYNLYENKIAGMAESPPYWRDVGTITSYYEANMDLKNPMPSLNLYNPKWPMRSVKYHDPPAKVVIDAEGRLGHLENSLIAGGSVVSGGWVRDSIIGRNVFIGSRALVEESIITGSVVIKDGAQIRRTIVDEGNVIKYGDRIGYEQAIDTERFYLDLDSGIVIVPKKWI
jgi:glucose-1-phosphate adenylyltransferase